MSVTSPVPSGAPLLDVKPLLQMTGISKRFQGVQALADVDLTVRTGEIHALMGGNGAGKSTLLNILSGLIRPDAGTIELEGAEHTLEHPAHAQRLGITTIHQELSTIPDLTVLENILLRHEASLLGDPAGWSVGRPSPSRSAAWLRSSASARPTCGTVSEFGALKKRAIEIVKALAVQPKVLILDEPTSGLEAHEKALLFDHMRSLQRRGVALIWVTHHLDEVFGLADAVTVMRDGRTVIRTDAGALTPRTLRGLHVRYRGGGTDSTPSRRPLATRSKVQGEQPRLKVEHLTREGVLRDISFELKPARSSASLGSQEPGGPSSVRALMGMDKTDAGQIYLSGKRVKITHPATAYKAGLAMVPEDRKQFGILTEFSIEKSISISRLRSISRAGDPERPRRTTAGGGYIERLGIKTPSAREMIRNLSGGNQQKVIISRCLNTNPRILIVDEPTQGIDVHAKVEVHNLHRDLAPVAPRSCSSLRSSPT